MIIPVIQIGNSRGIRLGKTVLEKYGIRDKVQLLLKKEQIILKPVESSRKNWDVLYKEMVERGHDRLLVDDRLQHSRAV